MAFLNMHWIFCFGLFFFAFLRISYAECIHCPLQYVEESYSCFSIIKRTLVNALCGIRRLCLAKVWRFSRGVLLFLTKYLFNKHSKQTKTCPFFRHNKRGSKQRPMMAHVRKHCLSCSTSQSYSTITIIMQSFALDIFHQHTPGVIQQCNHFT